MTYDSFWWVSFYALLAGNIFCWAVALLRVVQNVDRLGAKLVLLVHIFGPIGFVAAFLYGWVRRVPLGATRLMPAWSALFVGFLLLMAIEPTAAP